MEKKYFKKSAAITILICFIISSYGTLIAHGTGVYEVSRINEMMTPYLQDIVDLSNVSGIDEGSNTNEVNLELKNGTNTAYTFAEPVWYKDTYGQMTFKETNIKRQENSILNKKGYKHSNGKNDYRINFSEEYNNGLMVNFDNVNFTIIPNTNYDGEDIVGSVNKIIKNNEVIDTFLYDNLYGAGTKLIYTPQLNGIKEEIILDKYINKNKFSFSITTTNCYLDIVNGEVQFKSNNTDEVIQKIAAPFAYDAKNKGVDVGDNHYTSDCQYSLERISYKEYILTLTVSDEWLKSESTVYPVTIDPVTSNIANSMDTPIFSKRTSSGCYVDNNAVGMFSDLGVARSLIKFALPSTITAGATINSAYYWTRELTARTTSMYATAHMITGAWSNSTTYATQPSFNSSAMCTKLINGNSTDGGTDKNWFKFDITSAANLWTHGTTNNGFLIKSTTEGSNYVRTFAQLEYATSSYRPYTVINYTNDSTAPTITGVTQSPTAWTSGNVTLTATGINDNNGSGVHATPYSFSTTQGVYSWQASNVTTITGNKTVYVYVRDKLGNIALRKTINVTNIDKAAPTITGVTQTPTTWTNGNVTLTINGATDNGGSGAGATPYSFSTTQGVYNWQASNQATVNANKTIYIYVRDVLGNIALRNTYFVANIDTTLPIICSVDQTVEDGVKVLIINATDSGSGIDSYSFDNGETWQASNSKSFDNENDTPQIKVRDTAGNIASYSSQIDILDPNAPVIFEDSNKLVNLLGQGDIQPDGDTTKQVNELNCMEYKIDNGEWITYSDSFEIPRSHDVIIYARAIDNSGNISFVTQKTIKSEVGKYTESETDLSMKYFGVSFEFSRTYNPNSPFWFFSLESDVSDVTYEYLNNDSTLISSQAAGVRQVTFTDGQKFIFVQDNDGTYKNTQNGWKLIASSSGYQLNVGSLTYGYNSAGKLISITDKNSNSILISRTSTSIIVTDGANRTYTVGLDESGNIISITDPIGGQTVYTYTPNGLLSTASDASGVITGSYTYENNQITKSNDKTIGYTNGRVTSETMDNGRQNTYVYDDENNKILTYRNLSASSSVLVLTEVYNDRLDIISSTDEDGNETQINYTYDSLGRVVFETKDDITTTYSYDSDGYLSAVISSDGSQDLIYENGLLIREKNQDGKYVYYAYDDNENILVIATLKSTYEGDAPTAYSAEQDIFDKTTYTYNSNGNINTITDSVNDITHSYTYDSYGNATTVITVKTITAENGTTTTESKTSTFTYDLLDRMLTSSDGDSSSASIYDAVGRELKAVDDGKVTRYVYDNRGRLIQQIDNDQYDPALDGLNNETPVATYSNSNIGHRYAYAENGNLISETNKYNKTTTYTYDAYGNLITQAFDIYTFNYTVHGDLQSVLKGAQTLVAYTYDSNYNLQTITYANGHSISYTYNSNGKITAVFFGTEQTPRITYTYGEDGELSEKVDNHNMTRTVYSNNQVSVYRIGAEDEILIHSYSESSDTFTETAIGNTYTVRHLENQDQFILSDTQSLIINFSKSGDKITSSQITIKSGDETNGYTEQTILNTAYTYDGENISSEMHTLNGGNENLSYTYDDKNNITSVTRNGITTNYYYDSSNQLIRVDDGEQNKTICYTYDDRGNILTKSEYPLTLTQDMTEIEPTSTINYTYGNASWADMLTAYNGNEITYDSLGNRLSYNGWTYTWDMGRSLVGMTNADGTNISYKYDDSGIRTSKTVNGLTTSFTTIDGRITSQTDGINSLYFRYDSNGDLFGVQINGTDYVYVKNISGDVIAIADTSGTILVKYTYDAWGKTTSITGTMADTIGQLNPMRYRSYYYDAETGYFYVGSRYYDPEIGRFISPDLPEAMLFSDNILGTNLFAYCYNNPANYTDHSGMLPVSVKIAIGIAGIVAAVALTVASGGTLFPAILATLKFVAGSMAICMAIGGLIGYMQSGIAGLKKGLLDGAVNGFMWGGIGTAINAAIAFIKVTETIKNINQIYVKSKHLANASGGFAKFNTTSQNVIRNWVRTAILKGKPIPNGTSKDSYIIIYNLGKVIGTKGEKCIKVVYDIAGKIISIYPVK